MPRGYRPDDGLRALLADHLPHPRHLTAVETGSIRRGVPDCHVAISGVCTWIECKATRAWSIKFQPGQVGWIEAELRHGGRALLAVRRRDRSSSRRNRPLYDELWLIHGSAADHLQLRGLQWALDAPALLRPGDPPPAPAASDAPLEAVLGRWCGGPAAWDWAAVRSAILCARRG